MADKEFPKGVFFNEKHANAPEWVLGTIAIKLDTIDLEQLARYKNDKGYARIDIKKSRDGKVYGEFSTYGLQQDNDLGF